MKGPSSRPSRPEQPVTRRQRSRETTRASAGTDTTGLASLSTAARQHARRTTRKPTPLAGSILVALVAAIFVASALTLLTPFEYLSCATVKVNGNDAGTRTALYWQSWLAYAGSSPPPLSRAPQGQQPWHIDTPAPDVLRLCLRTTRRSAGVAYLQGAAEGFVTKMNAEVAAAQVTPPEDESVLSQQTTELLTRLQEAHGRLDLALRAPVSPMPADHEALQRRWDAAREQFMTTREELLHATEALEQLQAEAEPTHGMVSSDERRKAQEADLGLQQDLRELEVHLTELKLELLNVWQHSVAVLNQLSMTANEFAGIVQHGATSDGAADPPAIDAGSDSALPTNAEEYRLTVAAFAQAWNREFIAFRDLVIDPQSGELINSHERARSLLKQFLFNSGERLAAMQTHVRAREQVMTDEVKQHVRQSALIRGFAAAQSAHKQFEFTAEGIAAQYNHRLDIALKGSIGLRRRTQAQIQAIDEQLNKVAAQRAKRRQDEARTKAAQEIQALRAAADRIMMDVIDVHDALALSYQQAAEAFQSSLAVEVANWEIAATEFDLATLDALSRSLEARRLAQFGDSTLTLMECGAADIPLDLEQRGLLAGVGALITFLAVGMGNWWVRRKA